MEAQQQRTCFVVYPLGKLVPFINQFGNFLSLKPYNWKVNWYHALNASDYDTLLALSKLLNCWRQSEIHFDIPRVSRKIHTRKHYALCISQVLALLTEQKNTANHKIAQIIIQHLNFYYSKFQTIEDCIQFSLIIEEMIKNTYQFLFEYSSVKDKGNINEMLNFSNSLLVIVCLGSLTDYLGYFDGVIKQKVKIDTNPSLQSQTKATQAITTLIEDGCMPQLLSTLIHINIDFLYFMQIKYETEWEEYQLTKLHIRQNKNAINEKKRNELLKKHGNLLEACNTHLSKQTESKDQIDTPPAYMRNILKSVVKTEAKPKIFFAYLNPILRYLPFLIVNSHSEKQQVLIFEKIYLFAIKHLVKLYDEKAQHSFFIFRKHASYFSHADLIRCFRDTTFLDDLEVGLVSYFEQKIYQHKQVEGYETQYAQIQSYFNLIQDLRKKVIKAFDSTITDFQQYQLPFVDPLRLEKPGLTNQSENNNIQRQSLEQTNKKKQDSLNTSEIKGLRKFSNEKDIKQRKKPGLKPKQKKYQESISYIREANSEQEKDTDAQGEFKMQKIFKKEEKRKSKPRKTKKNLNETQKSSSSEDDLFQRNLKPVYKETLSVNPLTQSSKYLPKTKTQSVSSGHHSHPPMQKILIISSKKFQKRPEIIRADQLVSYYQHHSNSYSARRIFREQRIQHRVPNLNTPHLFYEHHFYHYPSFINRKAISLATKEQFRTNYKQIKKSHKKITVPESEQQQNLMRSIFEKFRQAHAQKQTLNNAYNRKSISGQQYTQKMKKIQQNLKKANEPKKRRVLQIYLSHQRIQSIIKPTFVLHFPLVQTRYGYITIRELTRYTQEYFMYLLKNQTKIQQSHTNSFNVKLKSCQEMVKQKIERYSLQKLHQLLLPMLYEILHILTRSNGALKSFYQHFYLKQPAYMQSMLVFYILQIEKRNHGVYHYLIDNFFDQCLQPQDLVCLLSFMIKDAKLVAIQIHHMYLRLYYVLFRKCFQVIQTVETLICEQIFPLVKKINFKQQHHHSRQKRFDGLEILKRRYYNSFCTMIDLINLWICLSYSSVEFQSDLPALSPMPKRPLPLIHFCNKCSGNQIVFFSIKQIANYQSFLCIFCHNSVVSRFQLNNSELNNLHMQERNNMLTRIMKSRERIGETLDSVRWNIERLPLFDYIYGNVPNQNNGMELFDNNDPQTREQKPKKTEDEYIQYDNQEWCFNNFQILECYLEQLGLLMNDALTN